MTQEMKQCPYCGEKILLVAKKCKFCGTWLDSKPNNRLSYLPIEDNFRNEFQVNTWAFVGLTLISLGFYFIYWFTLRIKYLEKFSDKEMSRNIYKIFIGYMISQGIFGFILTINIILTEVLPTIENIETLTVEEVGIIVFFYILYMLSSSICAIFMILLYFKFTNMYENYILKTYKIKIHLNRFLVFIAAPFYVNHTSNNIEKYLRGY